MADRYRFTVCLSTNDIDLINYLENKRKSLSVSVYVRELIRRDMEGQIQGSDLDKIYKFVLDRLRQEGHLNQLKDSKKEDIDTIDKELIMNLF